LGRINLNRKFTMLGLRRSRFLFLGGGFPLTLFVLAAPLAGCDPGTRADARVPKPALQATSGVPQQLNATDTIGADLGKYSAFWPQRTDQDLAAYVGNVATLFKQIPPKLLQSTGLRDGPVTPFDDQNLTAAGYGLTYLLSVGRATTGPERMPGLLTSSIVVWVEAIVERPTASIWRFLTVMAT
jgi:hypothetical protein